jgi:hypothetical protein
MAGLAGHPLRLNQKKAADLTFVVALRQIANANGISAGATKLQDNHGATSH